MKSNKEFISEYVEAMNGNPKTEELIDRYISSSDPELKGHIILFEAGIPCYEFIAEDMIAEGNKVMVRFTARGKHRGFLYGYEASGNNISIEGIIIYEITNSMITNHWMQADSVGLVEQMSKSAYSVN
jgi:SnoaL-like polyketide cyclase